mmetsp:Transcript_29770/g.62392  ORF Transcript_29770/g.62392 Transcript_29770/m.62392 type:complete len:390 (-) Transcript_29770:1623-2792(-)
MHGRGINSHGLLCCQVGTILEVIVLPLLLRLEPQTSQAAEILLAHRLVNSCASANTLPVVMRDIGPPVGLCLHIAKNHILDRDRHPGHFPGNIGLPAAPSLAEMLQDGLRLVLLHALGHHVQNVMHHRSAQLQIVVALDALLGHSLGNTLGVAAFELTGQEVAEPPFQKRHNTTQEEEPHSPTGRPESATRALADRPSVEAVVDQMLQVFAHANLPHQSVLVPIHASQLPDMGERVLEPICQLECIDVAETKLNIRIDNDFRQTEDLTAQVESVAESRLLALLGCQRLHWLQIKVVIKMEIIEILAMDEQIQHIVTLLANLKASFDPVDLRRLEKFCRAQNLEQIPLVEGLRVPMVQLVQHVALEQFLITHADLDRVVGRAVLLIPFLH